MGRSSVERNEVRGILRHFKEIAREYDLAEIRSGAWLARFVSESLLEHAGRVDAEFFALKYPGESTQRVIEKLVDRAKRRAALGGALTAGAYSAAVAATLGSGGTASLVTVPAGVLAFVADLFFQTSIQLHLAYDICILLGYPVDIDDPKEVRDLIQVALGAKPGDHLDLDPDEDGVGTTDMARYLSKGVTRLSRKALAMMGRRLLRKALIKLTMPAISIPLSSAMNYYSAGQTSKLAQQVFRDKATAREMAPRIAASAAEDPELLLEAMLLVMRADNDGQAEESWLLDEVRESLEMCPDGSRAVATVTVATRAEEQEVLRRISRSSRSMCEAIYEAVCEAATFDHELSRRERRTLKRLARSCGLRYDQEEIESSARRGR